MHIAVELDKMQALEVFIKANMEYDHGFSVEIFIYSTSRYFLCTQIIIIIDVFCMAFIDRRVDAEVCDR